jgi:ATP-dependent Clp protease ATP-binding subunit ClpC
MNRSSETEAILADARNTAIGLGHMYIGTEHILYCILSRRDCEAVRELEELKQNIDAIIEALKSCMGLAGTHTIKDLAHIPTTPRVRKAITLAEGRATRLQSSEMRPQDLLWGLLAEDGGIAACVLKEFNLTVTPEDLVEESLPASVPES